MLDPNQLIQRHELAALLAARQCRKARLAIELLYLTGQRPQELRLCQIGDMIGGRLRSPMLKRKRGAGLERSKLAQAGLTRADVVAWRWIPLGLVPRAQAVWVALAGHRGLEEPILPGRKGLLSRAWLSHRWARAWKAAGLRPGEPQPPLYSLRHTRATLLIEAGVKPAALCKLMGWSSIQMAMEYYEASPAILEEAMGRACAAV